MLFLLDSKFISYLHIYIYDYSCINCASTILAINQLFTKCRVSFHCSADFGNSVEVQHRIQQGIQVHYCNGDLIRSVQCRSRTQTAAKYYYTKIWRVANQKYKQDKQNCFENVFVSLNCSHVFVSLLAPAGRQDARVGSLDSLVLLSKDSADVGIVKTYYYQTQR